ncbi:substrate-binding periplasmic protein [Conchiformibius steedae]|uniref:Amino acid ABC transporter substrate-binding protein n=1 Tax=Conchiformibius steedae TaxID=153493 RepID=A0A3P2A1N6_9NEIS|nr:transporter substrate-binding domain-containing protein [Conchiformibius steedae]RRD89332.1 amino acid ABC transporter substrate-binding protein [Conchiformibius steedae]
MKKYLALCLTALALGACSDHKTPEAQQQASAPAAATVYRVGSQLSYPPFHFINEKGEPTGFEVEVLQATAKAGGFDVEIINTPRSGLERTLSDGTLDIWSSTISVKPERAEKMDFSQPFLQHDSKVIYLLDNDDNKNIQTLQDFHGKTLAVNKFSKNPAELAAKITGSRSNVMITDSYHVSMKAVYSKRADGALDNGYVLAYAAKQQPDFKMRSIVVENEKKDFAFAVKKGNTELLEKLNKGLQTVKSNGTYDKLFEKWFGSAMAAQQQQ